MSCLFLQNITKGLAVELRADHAKALTDFFVEKVGQIMNNCPLDTAGQAAVLQDAINCRCIPAVRALMEYFPGDNLGVVRLTNPCTTLIVSLDPYTHKVRTKITCAFHQETL